MHGLVLACPPCHGVPPALPFTFKPCYCSILVNTVMQSDRDICKRLMRWGSRSVTKMGLCRMPNRLASSWGLVGPLTWLAQMAAAVLAGAAPAASQPSACRCACPDPAGSAWRLRPGCRRACWPATSRARWLQHKAGGSVRQRSRPRHTAREPGDATARGAAARGTCQPASKAVGDPKVQANGCTVQYAWYCRAHL